MIGTAYLSPAQARRMMATYPAYAIRQAVVAGRVPPPALFRIEAALKAASKRIERTDSAFAARAGRR